MEEIKGKGIHVCIVGGPATEEERLAYQKAKNERFLKSLQDNEKQTPKAILGLTELPHQKGKFIGLCPVCRHCVPAYQHTCDECYQVLKTELPVDKGLQI